MGKKTVGALLVGLTLASVHLAEAQHLAKVPTIGSLFGTSAASVTSQRADISSLLRERGYVESKNIAFEYRYADNNLDRLPALADELVSLKVAVLVVRAAAPCPSR
jgi:putative ABC transport system substrate-binding protein